MIAGGLTIPVLNIKKKIAVYFSNKTRARQRKRVSKANNLDDYLEPTPGEMMLDSKLQVWAIFTDAQLPGKLPATVENLRKIPRGKPFTKTCGKATSRNLIHKADKTVVIKNLRKQQNRTAQAPIINRYML